MSSERDETETELALSERPLVESAPALRAVVIEGRDAGTAASVDLGTPGRVIIGTGPACDLRLTDPTVSRRHFAIEPASKRFRITDLGSTNGTFVDGLGVIQAFVNGGEHVRCGATVIRLDPERGPANVPSSATGFGPMLGASERMRRLYPLCEKLAASQLPVLIEGETGTGKEVLAEALYEVGGRRGPYVVFDCTAVAANLVEAELFGVERGAFTGAVAARRGLLDEADGGTLFIDEIGELDLPLQAKLLRAVDRGQVRSVGSNETRQVSVRILAATRRDLDREVEAGRFRDDLLHRLAVARIELPPLRERKGDVSLLARHFAEQLGAPELLTPAMLAKLEDYAWPGNVRELKNAVARLVALGELAGIEGTKPGPSRSSRESLSRFVAAIFEEHPSYSAARRAVLEEFEQQFVELALTEHSGNVARAAEAHGIQPRYLRMLRARHRGERE